MGWQRTIAEINLEDRENFVYRVYTIGVSRYGKRSNGKEYLFIQTKMSIYAEKINTI